MSTVTARDLPGRTSTAVRLAVWAALTIGVGGAGAYWAQTRGGLVVPGASPMVAVGLPFAVAVVAGVVWFAVHRWRGSEPEVGQVGEVRTPPSDHAPAEVGWLLRYGTVTTDDMAATLVDLAEQGLLTVDVTRGRLTPAGDPRNEAEGVVLRWLADGSGAVTDTTAAVRAAPMTWQRLWQRFCDAVEGGVRPQGLIERSAASEEIVSAGLLASSLIVLGAVGMARGYPAWLACVAAGAAILVFADTLARRSPQGADLAARWRAFCDHLIATPADHSRHAGHTVMLGVDAQLQPEHRFIIDAVEDWHEAYVTAAAFLSGPSARRRPRP